MNSTRQTTYADSSRTSLLAFCLLGLVVVLGIIVWLESLDWKLAGLSAYQLFPLFGLLAFSTMWSQYVVGFIARIGKIPPRQTAGYFRLTGYSVLVFILLHPGLLAYQRLRDGFGLPPGSETSYVAPTMAWIVVLGMVSLLVFLSYELRHWFEKYRWWHFVPYLVDLAMIAIFYHGLELGTQTHIAWFRDMWWFYGVSLGLILVQTYYRKLSATKIPQTHK